MSFGGLPRDCVANIAIRLDAPSAASFSECCREMHKTVSETRRNRMMGVKVHPPPAQGFRRPVVVKLLLEPLLDSATGKDLVAALKKSKRFESVNVRSIMCSPPNNVWDSERIDLSNPLKRNWRYHVFLS